jgi:hypothetical protein
VDRTPELALCPQIPWTERQNSRCVHGFRGPNARILVEFTDSVDRTPELSLPVHGFRGPNARILVEFTDSVDRTPELSLRSRIREPNAGSCHCVRGFLFYLKKPAKKRFNIDYYGPLAADIYASLVLTMFCFDPQRLDRSLWKLK